MHLSWIVFDRDADFNFCTNEKTQNPQAHAAPLQSHDLQPADGKQEETKVPKKCAGMSSRGTLWKGHTGLASSSQRAIKIIYG